MKPYTMVLKLGREAMPPGLAEDAYERLYRSSDLRPAPFLCEMDSSILVPSVLDFAAREYHAAGVLPDKRGQLFLSLDGTAEALRIARAMVRYSSGTSNHFIGVIGVWMEIGEEFDRPAWVHTVRFLSELSNSPAILILFVSAMNRPSVKQLVSNLCVHIPGLTCSVPWRYDYDQLTSIICAYIRHAGVQIHEPDRFEARLAIRIVGRVTTSEQAVMLGDILARQAEVDEEGRPFVTCEVIPYYGKGGECDDVPFQ